MKAITKSEFRRIEGETIESYSWYWRSATVQQQGDMFTRIRTELLTKYSFNNL
jgi:hypothetical protein